MKYIVTIFICLLSLACAAQTKDSLKTDSVKTITLTQLQIAKLSDIERKIAEMQQAQKELLIFIFDANAVDVNKVRNLKYENGKFIFTTEK